jgi:hypothetical protein
MAGRRLLYLMKSVGRPLETAIPGLDGWRALPATLEAHTGSVLRTAVLVLEA